MTAFQFKAIDAAGKSQSGMLEAPTPAAARQSLRGKGWLPVEITARIAPAGNAKSAGAGTTRDKSRMPMSALSLVTRQLATLLGSGLRIEEALSTIASGQPARVAAVLVNVRAQVVEGRSLADALAIYPQIFSDFYRASVNAGEQSGKLDHVMAHLSSHVENRARNRQSVQLALLYPALLGTVSLAIITLLMAYVVPDIVKVFRDRGADLPLLTRGLIVLSEAVRSYGLYALATLAAALLAASRWARHPANRMRLDGITARMRLVQRMNAAQFAGTLATLLQSQVPLVEALASAADVTPNLMIRARIAQATDKVRQGLSLQRAMTEAQVFPPMMVAMVASGEASGKLGQALDHAATEQQRDLDAWVKAVVALVEPLILVVMGGLVMAMVLAILLPIVSLNGLANG